MQGVVEMFVEGQNKITVLTVPCERHWDNVHLNP